MTSAYEPGTIPQFERHDRLSKACKIAGVSSMEMAEYAGVTRETMSRYLSGKQTAPLAVVRVIALRTGVPFTWLQNGEAPSPGGGDGASECARRDSNSRPSDLCSSGRSEVVPLRRRSVAYPGPARRAS